jgi:hypothetical protein
MGSSASLSEHFTVQLVPVPHPHYQAEAYSRAVDSLRAKIAAALPEQLPPSAAFATRAANGWTTVRKAPPPAPGRAELVPVYMVENAHADGAAQAEAALRAWQASVGKGRVVSGFGAKASELQRSVLSRYDADTIRCEIFTCASCHSVDRCCCKAERMWLALLAAVVHHSIHATQQCQLLLVQ